MNLSWWVGWGLLALLFILIAPVWARYEDEIENAFARRRLRKLMKKP
jgi:hypothetical protein